MTLPDWSSGINTQIEAFLGWSTIANNVELVIGTAVAVMMASLVMSIFLRGR